MMKKVIALMLCVVLLYQGLFSVSAETTSDAGPTVTAGDVVHADDANTGEAEETFDVVKAYEYLIGLETDQEVAAYLESLNKDQYEQLSAYATSKQNENVTGESEFIEHVPEIVQLARNYTNAVPMFKEQTTSVPAIAMYNSRMRSVVQPGDTESGNGLELRKWVNSNSDGSHTINLEAWTTGVVTQNKTTVPMDIVLILDQSGSMAWDFTGTDYRAFERETAVEHYEASQINPLWVKVGDSYCKVTINKTAEELDTYTPCGQLSNTVLYNNSSRLYYKDSEGIYHKVNVSWNLGFLTIVYTYKWNDTRTTSSGQETVPDFWENLYYIDTENVYTFTYTDPDGVEHTETVRGDTTAAPDWDFYETFASGSEPRLDALVRAVNGFVANVEEKAKGADEEAGTDDDVDHRIAVVGFSSDVNTYKNTELLTGVTITDGDQHKKIDADASSPYYYPDSVVKIGALYGSITDDQYKSALQSVGTAEGKTSIENAVDALTAHGGTNTADGLDMARQIFAKDETYSTEDEDGKTVYDRGERIRVVILFTDGATNSDKTTTIGYANDLKNDYSAKVYSIGIFEKANGETPAPDYGDDDTNRLMHLISSNYPNATSLRNSGDLADLPSDQSYYLSANNSGELSKVFETISKTVSATTQNLGSQTILKDIVSPYFSVPENVSDISVYLADYNGSSFGEPYEAPDGVDALISGDTVSVTGFDYKANFVSESPRKETEASSEENFYGRKVVIQFEIAEREGFLGGNGVPTNGSQSGIYDDQGNLIEEFQVPTIDVEIPEITVTAQDKNVYLLDDLSENEMKNGATSVAAGCDLFASLDWQDDYVNITHTTSNAMLDLTEDGQYTISTTIAPKESDGTVVQKSDSDTAEVFVYKPEITYQDSAINLGETADYDTQNLVSVSWKHGSAVADTAVMGEAPVLGYTCAPVEGAFTEDTPVMIRVVIGDTDVTGHVTFYRNACTFDGCTNASKTQVITVGKTEWVNFMVHIKSFDLTIIKTGVTVGDEEQAFIFRVTGPDSFSMDVVIKGNGRTTVKGLPAGDYTVTELTEWSKRYLPKENGLSVTTDDVAGGRAEVTFNNSRSWENWLTGENSAANQFTIKGANE